MSHGNTPCGTPVANCRRNCLTADRGASAAHRSTFRAPSGMSIRRSLNGTPTASGKRPRCCPYRGRQPWRFSSSARGANAGSKGSTGATKVGSKGKAPAVGHTKCYATGELPGSRRLARSEGERNDQLATYRSSRSSCSCHGGVFHLFRHRATASRSLARYQRPRYKDADVY